MNRRKFIGKIGLIGAGTVLAPSIALAAEAPQGLALDYMKTITEIVPDITPLDTLMVNLMKSELISSEEYLIAAAAKREYRIAHMRGDLWPLAEQRLNMQSSESSARNRGANRKIIHQNRKIVQVSGNK